MKFLVLLFSLAVLASPGDCQWKEPPTTGSPEQTLPDRTTLVGQSGLGPLVRAAVINEHSNAKNHIAEVEVQTDGVQLVEPSAAAHSAKLDEAHIQYRLDDGPSQNTTSTRLRFENLPRGTHLIRIALAGNDNHPIGKTTTLKIKIQ
jgi:hypothetical protein